MVKSTSLKISQPEFRDQAWKRQEKFISVIASGTSLSDLVDQFVARINYFTDLQVTASKVDGDTLAITDNAGYFTQFRGGPTAVAVLKNDKGLGFNPATDIKIQTTGRFASGIGSDLLKKRPLVDPLIGNAYVGQLEKQ